MTDKDINVIRCQRCSAPANAQTWDSKPFCFECARYLNFKTYPLLKTAAK